MTEYLVLAIVGTASLVLVLVRLSLRTYLKTLIEESVRDEFEKGRLKLQQDFDERLHTIDRQDRFRLAALDKRMEAHQRAFALGRKMLPLVHSQIGMKIPLLNECEEFWNTSALYLTEDAREAFTLAKHYFGSYDTYYTLWKLDPNKEEHKTDLEKAFSAINDLPIKLIAITDKEATGRVAYIQGNDFIDAFGQKEKSGKEK